MIATETMRERKRIMEDRADAFVIVPGGVGTFDEFFEILTLKQLKRHNKAMVIFNFKNYYSAMAAMMEKAVEEGFVAPGCLNLYEVLDSPSDVLDYIEGYKPKNLNINDVKYIAEEEK